MDKLNMGARIKEVRKRNGLTQEQLAEHLDVSVEFVGQIERGLKLPSMQVFIKLERICRLSSARHCFDGAAFGR